MPGFFSTVGTYMAGAGKYAAGAAMGKYGRTAAGAMWGGAYGAVSSDTSILGGAAMGAAGARYLGAGARLAGRMGAGMGLGAHAAAYGRAFARGAMSQGMRDYRGAMMAANRGMNRIRGLGRGIVPIA